MIKAFLPESNKWAYGWDVMTTILPIAMRPTLATKELLVVYPVPSYKWGLA